MTYEELINKRKELDDRQESLNKEKKELDKKIEIAKEGKAKSIFDNIIKEIADMEKLGYTIVVETDDCGMNGYNWHQFGESLRSIEMTNI